MLDLDWRRVLECIDQLVDLSHDAKRLSRETRKKILDDFIFVINMIAQHEKVVEKPTSDEIEALVQHRRHIISTSSDAKEIHLARLEIVAFDYQAMFLATNTFPSSTQIICLLNSMLHNGNQHIDFMSCTPEVIIGMTNKIKAIKEPLQRHDINVYGVQVRYRADTSQEDKGEAFKIEMDFLYESIFGVLSESKNIAEVRKKACACTTHIYNEYYKNYDRGTANADNLKFNERLEYAVSHYGNDAIKEDIYKIVTKHCRDHSKNGRYVQLIMQKLHRLRETNVIKPDANISHQQLFGVAEANRWKDLYKNAMRELNWYAWSPTVLAVSSDRQAAVKKLKSDINKLKHRSDLTDNAKIALLIEHLNAASESAIKTDLQKDQKKFSWRFFSYRNSRGSRFQSIISKIHDKATAYYISPSSNCAIFDKSQIPYFKEILTQLLLRANLVKIKDKSIIKDIRTDTKLSNLIDNLRTVEDIPAIIKELSAYNKKLRLLSDSDKNIYSFYQLSQDVQNKLVRFKRTHALLEISQNQAGVTNSLRIR